MQKSEIFLCAINNVLSGTCREDCGFCSQSIHHGADIERYSYKDPDTVMAQARRAKEGGALGYCLVTAGKGLDDKKTEYIARLASAIKKELPGLRLIACNGTAKREELAYLKESGIDSYNHNLESSEKYYGSICSTHSWQERYETCLAVKSAGLSLCSGGIFGMGESESDRDELIDAISSLEPESVPLNFYHPNPALPLKERNIDREAALDIIRKSRSVLGEDILLMVAGGRELIFGGYEKSMFDAGANSIVLGDYLTTRGQAPRRDIEIIEKSGYKVAGDCGTR